MFKRYFELVKNLFESISSGSTEVTFGEYLMTIGYTLGIAAIIVIILILVTSSVYGPIAVHKKLFASLVKKRNELCAEGNCAVDQIKEVKEVLKKIRIRTILYVLGLVILYIPIMVPTVLYLLYVFVHI